ncbi:hypothetical protein PACILC2_51010 [Paenibacillus cisolokensis]|uniref:P-type Cu(+) transporter n=1 Tax=Paenibacillus cisolokensis TaxID=1658519 RepID=A0ABQ4NE63_9BACL|nr:hypothetical protein PACILC2_51010 [Paenibacillus cisolokensis]
MLVAIDGRYAGMVAVADTVKETSKAAVGRLKEMGIQVIMMTGDNERTARAIAAQVGIEHVRTEVLPEEKAEQVRKLQAEGKRLPWSETALTMRRRWRRPISAWRSARGRTSRWKRPTSR